MSLGILVRHAAPSRGEPDALRCDVAAFVGLVLPGRWPEGASAGDVVSLVVDAHAPDAVGEAWRLDPATRSAIRAFFENGGVRCVVHGVCAADARDLAEPRGVEDVLDPVLERLVDDEEATLLAAPVLAWLPPGAGSRAAAVRLLRHCAEVGHRLLLLDPPRHADAAAAASHVGWLRAHADVDPSFGALYFPWLRRGDRVEPPSGAVAGLHARVVRAHAPHGVRVAPANVPLAGVDGAEVELGWRDADGLVRRGVCPIVVEPGRGLVVAGACTLSQDPRWSRIVPRRIVSLVAEQLRRDAAWAVFEHLGPELWDAVGRCVRARLDELWAAGLLAGGAARAEYGAWCDATTNPPEARDAGRVVVRVRLRPVTATEHIDVELGLGG